LDGTVHPDPDPDDDVDPVLPQVILIEANARDATTVLGFTIRDGDDGISCHAKATIAFNRFVNNTDGIDYEGGGGLCRHNTFVANDDDAVDLDLACEAVIEDNLICDNDDDGIEIRLHEYRGAPLQIIIRRNLITGNGEDGIQIIDYPDRSDRVIRIERNVIATTAMAGIGCRADGNTHEDYQAASIPERIEIVNNTLCENQYGITGGDNALVINNILVGHQETALKGIDGQSTITHNVFWDNGADMRRCRPGHGKILRLNPHLDAEYRPAKARKCVDAGHVHLEINGKQLRMVPEAFSGPTPDVGAHEHD
jgi:hypothetical protein